MKPVLISKPASAELIEAVRWYEMKRPGLGGEFHDAVVQGVDLLSRHPGIGTPRQSPRLHRLLRLDRFPYQIVYRERADDLYIVAIAHARRRPGYWKGRIPPAR